MNNRTAWFCLLFGLSPILIPLAGLAFEVGVRLYGWTRDSHRRNHSRCVHCGYSLEGNVSGVCPECGNGIPPHHRVRR